VHGAGDTVEGGKEGRKEGRNKERKARTFHASGEIKRRQGRRNKRENG